MSASYIIPRAVTHCAPSLRALLLASLGLLLARPGWAQFTPEGEPGREQQEITTAILLGPEATLLGAFLGGGAVYLVEKSCCTASGQDPQVDPIAVGAAIGSTIGTTWAIWSVSGHFHEGSKRNAAIGALVGSGVGAAVYFGGPGSANESSQDQLFRSLTFLFLPTLTSLLGWHIEAGAAFESRRWAPPTPAGYALGPGRERPPPMTTAVSFRF